MVHLSTSFLKFMDHMVHQCIIFPRYTDCVVHILTLFKNIHVTFNFKGDLKAARVKRAVALSMDKYCSVAKILEETATITYGSSINGEVVV